MLRLVVVAGKLISRLGKRCFVDRRAKKHSPVHAGDQAISSPVVASVPIFVAPVQDPHHRCH
jgi:hypothetical protein